MQMLWCLKWYSTFQYNCLPIQHRFKEIKAYEHCILTQWSVYVIALVMGNRILFFLYFPWWRIRLWSVNYNFIHLVCVLYMFFISSKCVLTVTIFSCQAVKKMYFSGVWIYTSSEYEYLKSFLSILPIFIIGLWPRAKYIHWHVSYR